MAKMSPPRMKRPWREIAEEMRYEENPGKMLELAIELNNTMLEDEREREKARMERNPSHKRRSMCLARASSSGIVREGHDPTQLLSY